MGKRGSELCKCEGKRIYESEIIFYSRESINHIQNLKKSQITGIQILKTEHELLQGGRAKRLGVGLKGGGWKGGSNGTWVLLFMFSYGNI